MSRRFALVAVVLIGTVAFLTGFDVAGSLQPPPAVAIVSAASIGGTPTGRLAGRVPLGLVDFADVAERVNPAVVNIDATSRGHRHRMPVGHPPLDPFNDPFDNDGAHGDGRDLPRRGAGSGFVIDPSGYILTNNHVVEKAERLMVKLADGRSFRARIVGADPDTDIALIKVEAGGVLPAAVLGDSGSLRVGDWVCAIGNPLGYEHTLTVGVVSFLGRKLFDRSLDNYIQTDAAINFGNSGGPLINTRGEVIGINAAISSRASNIGFAVPVNTASVNLAQLKSNGRVVRGYMGVTLREVDPDLQESMHIGPNGALVEDVADNSPASRAGLKPYDVIVSLDGRAVANNDELIGKVSEMKPGTGARLDVLRDGQRRAVLVKLAERPGRGPESDGVPRDDQPAPTRNETAAGIGLAVRDIDHDVVKRLNLPHTLRGVVVSQVEPLSPAYDSDIERGFVILEVNRQPVESVGDYRRLTAGAKPGAVLMFFLYMPGGLHALRTVRVEGQ
jgi:serine protease Do